MTLSDGQIAVKLLRRLGRVAVYAVVLTAAVPLFLAAQEGPAADSTAVDTAAVIPGAGEVDSAEAVPAVPLPGEVEPVLDTILDKEAQPDADSLAGPEGRDTLTEPAAPVWELNPRALSYNGIYLSGPFVSDTSRLRRIIDKTRGTPVNGFVIDMKDDQGYLSYRSSVPMAERIGSSTRRVRDPRALVSLLHDNGLVACARVVSFKDPKLSLYCEKGAYPFAVLDSATGLPWEQDNGETWANPMDPEVRGYLLDVIAELVEFGFDQIQLDYIRFPSDGDTGTCFYPVRIDSLNKAEVIGLLLGGVREIIDTTDVSLAADVFGWVPWLRKDRNYWIGQDYDVIAEYADVICPMLYSSHFPDSFKTEYDSLRAYHIVREGTAKAVERRGARPTGVQPYIQGFEWHAPYYGRDYILQQMRAAMEAGAVGWIVWNARNDYTDLWSALGKEADSTARKSNRR